MCYVRLAWCGVITPAVCLAHPTPSDLLIRLGPPVRIYRMALKIRFLPVWLTDFTRFLPRCEVYSMLCFSSLQYRGQCRLNSRDHVLRFLCLWVLGIAFTGCAGKWIPKNQN
ncbi:unnamed protein product [Protopolystoma xenopodis]|uniref:Secreted protein n=1 Tax=Protopolystoma xenopodis TaxID=117903 RepID=A0A3S5CRV5_9PLAT|nr:unnamed protein product [Protopolystoma xenopodis]